PVNAQKEKLPQTGDKAKQEIALTVVGIVMGALLIAWRFVGIDRKTK
ncbi:LPXTG cell wall anchor domain-containing protein, partial [Staphylococcus haemolyticus]